MSPSPALLAAEALAPALAEAARATDTEGLSGELAGRLELDGLFAPGGAEAPLVGRTLARACAAAAWTAVRFADTAGIVPEGLTARASLADRAELRRVGDSWRLDGAWRAGGLDQADQILLPVTIEGEEALALARREEVTVEPYAYLGGLRGVRWSVVTAEGLILGEDRVIRPAPAIDANALLGVVLGCAEGGLADYVRMTRARVSGIGGEAVASFTQVQVRLAEAAADLKAAALLFEEVLAGGDETETARDRAFIARKCLDAITRLVRQMGAMGIAESNPVQRRYRDLRALVADPALDWDRHLMAQGKRLLGIGEARAADRAA